MQIKTVRCLLCNRGFARLGTHVRSHGIKIQEYKDKFPGAPTCAYVHSQDTLEKMRGPREGFRGHKKSKETKQKLRDARLGKKTRPHSAETLEKMRQAWVRRKADKEKYADYVKSVSARMTTPEMLLTLRKRFAKLISEGNTNGKSSDTSLERKMANYLTEHGIEFKAQYILSTRKGDFTFDFMTDEKLLIEVDGEYWHSKSLEQINRDMLKERLATEVGYSIIRISDADWCPQAIHYDENDRKLHNEAIITRRLDKLNSRPLQ